MKASHYLLGVIFIELLDSHTHGATHLHDSLRMIGYCIRAPGNTIIAVAKCGNFLTLNHFAKTIKTTGRS